MKMVVVVYLAHSSFPVGCGIRPGVVDSSWSMDVLAPGLSSLSLCIVCSSFPLVLHGFLVIFLKDAGWAFGYSTIFQMFWDAPSFHEFLQLLEGKMSQAVVPRQQFTLLLRQLLIVIVKIEGSNGRLSLLVSQVTLINLIYR